MGAFVFFRPGQGSALVFLLSGGKVPVQIHARGVGLPALPEFCPLPGRNSPAGGTKFLPESGISDGAGPLLADGRPVGIGHGKDVETYGVQQLFVGNPEIPGTGISLQKCFRLFHHQQGIDVLPAVDGSLDQKLLFCVGSSHGEQDNGPAVPGEGCSSGKGQGPVPAADITLYDRRIRESTEISGSL